MIGLSISTTPLSPYSGQNVKSWPPFKVAPHLLLSPDPRPPPSAPVSSCGLLRTPIPNRPRVPCGRACRVAHSCPTPWDPVDCSPPGSSVHGTLQARTLEWAATSFSRRSPRPRGGSASPTLPHWQAGSLLLAPPGKPDVCPEPHSIRPERKRLET